MHPASQHPEECATPVDFANQPEVIPQIPPPPIPRAPVPHPRDDRHGTNIASDTQTRTNSTPNFRARRSFLHDTGRPLNYQVWRFRRARALEAAPAYHAVKGQPTSPQKATPAHPSPEATPSYSYTRHAPFKPSHDLVESHRDQVRRDRISRSRHRSSPARPPAPVLHFA